MCQGRGVPVRSRRGLRNEALGMQELTDGLLRLQAGLTGVLVGLQAGLTGDLVGLQAGHSSSRKARES